MPILIFSHGFTGSRFQNYTLCNYLASHGYVVVAPDHTCNALIVPFPDAPLPYSIINAPITLFERKKDISFLIDQFVLDPPEMFAERLNKAKIGIFGHSFGGFTISESIKTEHRPRAMVQLASFGFPWNTQDASAPSLYLWGQQDGVMEPFEEWHFQNMDQMPSPKWNIEFRDTGHFAFSDYCIFSQKLANGGDGCGEGFDLDTGAPFMNPDHEQIHDIMNPYTTAFFGAVFFGYEELENYLKKNIDPEWVDVLESTE